MDYLYIYICHLKTVLVADYFSFLWFGQLAVGVPNLDVAALLEVSLEEISICI